MSGFNWSNFIIALIAFIVVFLVVAKLYSPTVANSAIIAAVIAVLLFFICTGYLKADWNAVTAIAAIIAIIWAIWHQEIRHVIRSPKIDIVFLEPSKSHLAKLSRGVPEKGGIIKEYEGYCIACVIINGGMEIAERGQVYLSRIAEKINDGNLKGKWKHDQTWIPIPLKWVLPFSLGNLHIELFRDLVPMVPYPFTVGSFSNIKKDGMLITYITCNKSREDVLKPGEYCLELKVFAKGIDSPSVRYLHIKFNDFSKETNLDGIHKHIEFVNWRDKFPKCEVNNLKIERMERGAGLNNQ